MITSNFTVIELNPLIRSIFKKHSISIKSIKESFLKKINITDHNEQNVIMHFYI